MRRLGDHPRRGSAGLGDDGREDLAAGLAATDDPLVAGQRGTGLWRALLLTEPVAAAVEQSARERGFLVNAVRPDVIRLCPPLTITTADVDQFLAALPGILRATREDLT